jgi:hypothetical protein
VFPLAFFKESMVHVHFAADETDSDSMIDRVTGLGSATVAGPETA